MVIGSRQLKPVRPAEAEDEKMLEAAAHQHALSLPAQNGALADWPAKGRRLTAPQEIPPVAAGQELSPPAARQEPSTAPAPREPLPVAAPRQAQPISPHDLVEPQEARMLEEPLEPSPETAPARAISPLLGLGIQVLVVLGLAGLALLAGRFWPLH